MPKHHWFNQTGLDRDQVRELTARANVAFLNLHQALLPHCWQPADPAQPFFVHEGKPEHIGHNLATAFPLTVRCDNITGRIPADKVDRSQDWHAGMHGPAARAAQLAAYVAATGAVLGQADRILGPLGWTRTETQHRGSHHAGCRWTRDGEALTVIALARGEPAWSLYESPPQSWLGEMTRNAEQPVRVAVDVVISASGPGAQAGYDKLLEAWSSLMTEPQAEYDIDVTWPTDSGIQRAKEQAESRRLARNAAADALRLEGFGFTEGEDDPRDEDNVLSELPEVIFRRNEAASHTLDVRGDDCYPVPGAPKTFRPVPGALPQALEKAFGRLAGHVQLVRWTSPGTSAKRSRLVTESSSDTHGLRDDLPNLEPGDLHIRMKSKWTGQPLVLLTLKPWEEIPEMLIRRLTSNIDRRTHHWIRKAIWNSLRFEA